MVFNFLREEKDKVKNLEILAYFYQIPLYLYKSYTDPPKIKYPYWDNFADHKYKSIFSVKSNFLLENKTDNRTYDISSGHYAYHYAPIKKTLEKYKIKFEDLINNQSFNCQLDNKQELYLYEKIGDWSFNSIINQYGDGINKSKYLNNFKKEDFDNLPRKIVNVEDLPNMILFQKYIKENISYGSATRRQRHGDGPIWKEEELRKYEALCKKNEAAYPRYIEEYNKNKKKFEDKQNEDLKLFNEIKSSYDKGTTTGVINFLNLVLTVSPYNEPARPKNFEYEYDEESKILIINCELPDFERINIYNPTKKEDKPVSKLDHKRITESCLYLTPIRIIYECFCFDTNENIESIGLNGIVESFNKATGNLEKNTVLSLLVKRHQMLNLNLENVDPKECFKSLKGVSASKIHEYIPIQPIITFKKDSRIIESKEVLDNLKEENLAVMEWDEFEHLIRELFAKEFSQDGAEVKITQASRDRGVDAIAYDPDPIRGGKFVIQAKRYTATVDVSAVRDLYGTILNEGANRGILVTTAKFGSDAYDFAKDKNITLLEGNQLLGLLNKHGYNFKIDIREARKILNLTPKKTY